MHNAMKRELSDQLDHLLCEDVSSAIDRERSAFDRTASPCTDSLVLFGAGRLGRRTLAGLRSLGITPFAFADNNPLLWHKTVDGLEVLPPAEAARTFGKKAAFVVTVWSDQLGHPVGQVAKQLSEVEPQTKVVSFGLLYWKYSETFAPYFSVDLPHKTLEQAHQVRAAYQLWTDDTSRLEYVAQVKWRLRSAPESFSPAVGSPQYFCDDLFSLNPNEVFVDCGAYDGDTLRFFLQQRGASFSSVVAFEPDEANFDKLKRYVSGLSKDIKGKIRLLKAATGARAEKLRFNAQGDVQSALSKTGDVEVDCTPLDSIFSTSSPPSYIKMDIEGAELETLAGAQRILREATPILAVSVYHRSDDLWKLPLFIQSRTQDYRFYLRPHASAGWDTVCYAVPRHRVKIPL